MGPYQVLPLQERTDLGEMAIKGYSVFPKLPALLEPHHQILLCHIRTLVRKGSYPNPSAEKQSVYSTGSNDTEMALHTHQMYRTGASPFDAV